MKPAPFRYERPAQLADALALLAEHGDDARPLAGGQSLVPMLNLRLSAPSVVVDLNGLECQEGLAGTTLSGDAVRVGALTRQRHLELSPVAAAFGALADGLPLAGHVATRNRGTVGGSLAHADAAAELPLALLALGGSVMVDGTTGRREIPAADLFSGFLTTTLAPAELITEMLLPVPVTGEGSALEEVAQRHGDFALASAAVWVRLTAGGEVVDARVALGAVEDRPVLVEAAGKALTDGADATDAARVAMAAVDPIGSLHAPPAYQRHLVGVLVARAIRRAVERARRSVPLDPAALSNPPAGRFTAEPPQGTTPGCTVNGRPVSLAGVPARRLLSDFLRHDVGLRGTHVGCEHGVCGACTVLVDGAAVRSCLLLAVQAAGTRIRTVEGLAAPAPERTLHPLQDALRRHFALQCGFCTPGILMSATERLDAVPGTGPPSEDEVRRLLSGHLCRCTGYEPIVAAITEAAGQTGISSGTTTERTHP